jgi:hypothetical protein
VTSDNAAGEQFSEAEPLGTVTVLDDGAAQAASRIAVMGRANKDRRDTGNLQNGTEPQHCARVSDLFVPG